LEGVIERLRHGDAEATREYTRHKLLSVFTRACLAVDYAHTHGVLHRDLKPANMMLGRFGEVYVLDWGLAKRIDPELATPTAAESQVSAGSGLWTAPGVVVGTPAYMSPEQIEGRREIVGPQADVYALGAILFEILTLETLHGTGSPAKMFIRALSGVEARP